MRLHQLLWTLAFATRLILAQSTPTVSALG